jgi:hypothetical protein
MSVSDVCCGAYTGMYYLINLINIICDNKLIAQGVQSVASLIFKMFLLIING